MRLQLTTRASLRDNQEFGTQMLMFSFHLGPLEVFCLSHMPLPGEIYARTYVKVRLRARALMEDGKRAEEWALGEKDDGAWSAPGHARVSGGIPGGKLSTEVRLGPLVVTTNGEGEVACTLVPRRTVEDESRVIEHWAVAK